MKRKFCVACGTVALALAACSEDSGSNALNEQGPVADVSSSSVVVPLSSLAESSGSVEQSSSSLFGLSSSSLVSESSSSKTDALSSSLAESSGAVQPSSSSATILSSSSAVRSSNSCQRMLWNGYDVDLTVSLNTCGDSTWPKNAIADGRWRVMETDSSCVYCEDYTTGKATSGNSSVVWPDGVSENGEVPTSAIESCYGVCGTAALKKGTLTFQPFVSIGFALAKDSSGKPVPVDVSKWGGICISYISAAAPSLQLDLGDSLNAAFGYALPGASLAKSSVGWQKKCIPWESFKLPSWYRKCEGNWCENAGVMASKQLVGVWFKIQANEGDYRFEIQYLSSND